jgi:hypothetical protein
MPGFWVTRLAPAAAVLRVRSQDQRDLTTPQTRALAIWGLLNCGFTSYAQAGQVFAEYRDASGGHTEAPGISVGYFVDA